MPAHKEKREGKKIDSTPPLIVSSSLMRAARQQKKSVVKLGFQMFYYPIVAL